MRDGASDVVALRMKNDLDSRQEHKESNVCDEKTTKGPTERSKKDNGNMKRTYSGCGHRMNVEEDRHTHLVNDPDMRSNYINLQ